jgi:hypothetical protein
MPITKDTPVGDIIKDFQQSDAPQFKGKSKKKIQKMAIAAFYDKQNESVEIDESKSLGHMQIHTTMTKQMIEKQRAAGKSTKGLEDKLMRLQAQIKASKRGISMRSESTSLDQWIEKQNIIKEGVEQLDEIAPKVIPMGSDRHPAADPTHPKHAEWKAAKPKRVRKMSWSDYHKEPRVSAHKKSISAEDAYKAVEKEKIGDISHIVYAHNITHVHNGKKVAAKHIGTYHSIDNEEHLGLGPDEAGSNEEIFHHIVHRDSKNPKKLHVYQTGHAKNWHGIDESVELDEGIGSSVRRFVRSNVLGTIRGKLRKSNHDTMAAAHKEINNSDDNGDVSGWQGRHERASKRIEKAMTKTNESVEYDDELTEAVDPLHQKLRSLGYKLDSKESTPGEKKSWWQHKDGKHPYTHEELAPKIGHKAKEKITSYDEAETINHETGDRTTHQGGGLLFVGQPKKNKQGLRVRRAYAQGRDPSAMYEETEQLDEAKPKVIVPKSPSKTKIAQMEKDFQKKYGYSTASMDKAVMTLGKKNVKEETDLEEGSKHASRPRGGSRPGSHEEAQAGLEAKKRFKADLDARIAAKKAQQYDDEDVPSQKEREEQDRADERKADRRGGYGKGLEESSLLSELSDRVVGSLIDKRFSRVRKGEDDKSKVRNMLNLVRSRESLKRKKSFKDAAVTGNPRDFAKE